MRKGDTLGLFCPAGPVKKRANFETGLKIITDAGFKVKVAGHTHPDHAEYLAGSDQQRARNFLSLYQDDSVKGIMAIRGGFGCMRLIPYIDFSKLLHHPPKPVIGFSDVTVLLAALTGQANIVSYHGPVVTSLAQSDKDSLNHFFAQLTGSRQDEIKAPELEILRPGEKVKGKLAGGNLTTLIHLFGTKWDFTWDDSILVLEDTNEQLYRLDRLFTQLAYSGRLDRLKGLILGQFDTGKGDTLENIRLQEQIWYRVLELCKNTDFPIWGNFPCGHLNRNFTLPLGMTAGMDSGSGILSLDSGSIQAL